MQMICKNCNYDFAGNYCPDCGQKAKTEQINWKYLQDEFKYTFLHINGGFFYTIKELLTRPGHAIREFLEGKRVRHYKPILLLFVLAGLYGFLLHYIDYAKILTVQSDKTNPIDTMAFYEWMRNNYSFVEIALLPLIAFTSWLAFRKWKYNFIEHLILNAFIAAQRLIITLMFYPLMLIFDSPSGYTIIFGILSSCTLLATGWSYMQFYDDHPAGPTILRVLLMSVYFIMLVLLLTVIATVAYLTVTIG
ncbi:MAG TPA: DUF3667 domain-containing protein [Flavobacterium sp.]|jgi:hypothetical protein|nr:DUF3667 domain-containing protein [Flavobacterium sp.]